MWYFVYVSEIGWFKAQTWNDCKTLSMNIYYLYNVNMVHVSIFGNLADTATVYSIKVFSTPVHEILKESLEWFYFKAATVYMYIKYFMYYQTPCKCYYWIVISSAICVQILIL